MKRGTMAVVSVAALLMAGGAAVGVPRDSLTLTNQNSDQLLSVAGSGTLVQTAAYTARFARVRGSLSRLIANSFTTEAQVLIAPSVGGGGGATGVSPFGFNLFNGSTPVDTFARLNRPVVAGVGASWGLTFLETFDDGAGADARWDTITVTLNDGPPAIASDLGVIEARAVSKSFGLSAGQTVWFRFDLPVAIAGGAYLDIDTIGTAIGTGNVSNDTELVLYDGEGTRVGYGDDLGVGSGTNGYRWSLLSYGVGGGATGVPGVTAAGVDGALPAGTYWLAVKGFGSTALDVGWDVANTSTFTGTVRLNIRSNVGAAAWCAGDFNRDDTKNVADIFAFLSSWFAGCP
ncbi:MAG: hypothetical protein K2Q20_11560 [Phycisphaerales bacterium]|nr:hypothetical protein [Phycisphaerales bacterium]